MKRNIILGDFNVKSGTLAQGFQTVTGTPLRFPMTVINGQEDGPIVLITSGIHSCEYVGIEATIQLTQNLDPSCIRGAIILIHPVNLSGFEARTPTIVPEDGKNLNRLFPGDPHGSVSDRLADFLAREFFNSIDFYIDLHGGEIYDHLTPYIYYVGATEKEVTAAARAAAMATSVPYAVKSFATTGAYNYAGTLGIPSVLLERGCAGRVLSQEVDDEIADVKHILAHLNVLDSELPKPKHSPIDLTDLVYLMPIEYGLWYPKVRAGHLIQKDQLLGTMKDCFGQVLRHYHADFDGIVLYVTETLRADNFAELITYGRLVK